MSPVNDFKLAEQPGLTSSAANAGGDATSIDPLITEIQVSSRLVDQYRQSSVLLSIISIGLAVGMSVGSGIRIDLSGDVLLCSLIAATLMISIVLGRRSVVVGDAFGALSLIWVASIACGIISLMGLRLHVPLADTRLRSMDQALGVDTIEAVSSLMKAKRWLLVLATHAYRETVLILFLSIILLALLGRRETLWRATFWFIGSLVFTCLISITVPAKGWSVWASRNLMSQLPPHAGRFFWPTFDRFYATPDPILHLQSIGAVVSFPSFHAIMGMIALAMWRDKAGPLSVVFLWWLFMMPAAVLIGGHYIADLLAGVAVWLFWFFLSSVIDSWEDVARARELNALARTR